MTTVGAVVNDTTPAKPADYGLLSSATSIVKDSDPHWINKFDYETLDCVTSVHLETICNNSVQVTGVVQPSANRTLYKTYFPFGIISEFQCSTLGNIDVEQIVKDGAEACAQKAVEYEFWTGALAKAYAESDKWDSATDGAFPNRYLASPDANDVTPNGTGVRVKQAIALLEQALADCGCGIQGTIHLTREVASVLNLKPQGDTLRTNLGTTVIAGTGYTGTGPDGTDPGVSKAWAYATGPVTVRLGNIEVIPDNNKSQAVDTEKNTMKYFAEQPAAVTWNSCCHAAVLVDLSLDYD